MTIASMGTALTQEQAKMIKRFVDKVYICYDGDAPGQSATIRGLDILKDNGLDVMVVQLPDGFDPDDVIKTYGKDGYQKILDDSLPLIEFKVKFIKSKYDLKSVDGRAKYLNEAIQILAQVKNDVERELYIPMVGEIASTNIDFIKQEIIKKLDGKSIQGDIENKLSKVNKTVLKDNLAKEIEADDSLNPAIIKAEKYILYSLIHSKPYAHFKTDISYLFSGKRVYIYNLIMLKKNDFMGAELVQNVFNDYGDEDKSIIADIVNYGAESAESEENERKYFIDCVRNIYVNYLSYKLKILSEEYTAEIDNLKRKEISEKMKEISIKLKNKSVEELWIEKRELI